MTEPSHQQLLLDGLVDIVTPAPDLMMIVADSLFAFGIGAILTLALVSLVTSGLGRRRRKATLAETLRGSRSLSADQRAAVLFDIFQHVRATDGHSGESQIIDCVPYADGHDHEALDRLDQYLSQHPALKT